MSAQIIDGKHIAEQIKSELKEQIDILRARGVVPGLAAVLVGDNPASALYVKMKASACDKIGVYSEIIRRDAGSSHDEILKLVQELNDRNDIDGILVQSPLPEGINESAITVTIHPIKDVDGFHPFNQGLLLAGRPLFEPATPLGIVELLNRSGFRPTGKHVVILGRGFLVGKPLATMLASKTKAANATVTLCHTGTPNISHFTRQADIIVAAMGKVNFLTADMVKPGAVVIDVGTNEINDPGHPKGKRVVGDVDFESVKEVAGAITPVPGGVGPMTIAALLCNTVKACKYRRNLS
jgi:methylenetetrahydrofolate dehydrogenase (NADP+)/methenyltetrahydrofolate cyclohydrolase